MSSSKVYPNSNEEQDDKRNGSYINAGFSHDKTDLENGVKRKQSNSEDDDRDLVCSFGPCRPSCLQWFLNVKWFVVWLCIFGFIEGAAVNGVVNIVLTTLERQYNLPSSQSGLIVSSTDIGAVIFVLIVSYIGSKGNRPKWIAGGSFLMAVGSLIFTIPHITSDPYEYGASTANESHICSINNTEATCQTSSGSGSLYVFMLAQFVHGVGFTPMFTLGTAYVDDNAPTSSTAVYLGLIYALTALGVAAGYVGGGQFLTIWVDFDKSGVDINEISENLSNTDPAWVGAWWLGFVVTAVTFFLVSIPIFGYPINLPGTQKIREARKTDADRKREEIEKNDTRSMMQKFMAFPKAILALVKIPTYVIITLGGSAETLIIGGLAAFAPKILEEKFDMSPFDAGFIMGGVTLGGGAGGMVLGGVLIKCLKLDVRGMMRLCTVMSVSALLVGAGFFINCPDINFTGLTKPYMKDGTIDSTNSLLGYCNEDCRCNTLQYEPVCGADGFTYFSPCHAGCNDNYTVDGMMKKYAYCECVYGRLLNESASALPSSATASSGECATSCDLVYLFIVLLFLGMLFTLTTVTPASMAILRCVPDEHRALGLGLQWVCLRLLGTIPGPVLTGYVIDTACGLWQDFCGERGSCWVYDRYDMSWRLFVWWCCVKVFSGASFFISSLLLKPEDKSEGTTLTDLTRKDENSMGTEKSHHASTFSGNGEHRSINNDDKLDRNGITDSTYM